ncbi:MAG: ISAs1 family transposase [Spirochaetia bacterium]|nr:ISAs1 family transposase [Spirochaetia bacterium]
MLRTQREIDGKHSSEKLYNISSCKADAQGLASAIRGHWGIENSLHWVLDIAFREDGCRKRKENLRLVIKSLSCLHLM